MNNVTDVHKKVMMSHFINPASQVHFHKTIIIIQVFRLIRTL